MPWLHATPDSTFGDSIVLARSGRYNNVYLDYGFLQEYSNLVFVGVEQEYQRLKVSIPKLEYQPVKDFLEMAQVIAGAKFFIGNQSFPYAIAEAMKVRRVLEVCFYAPNVVIHGANGYDVYFQKHFESIVRKLNG